MSDDVFAGIKMLAPAELERHRVIKPAKVAGTYICPYCGNGSGKDGDGLTVKEYGWGFNYHCFKEGKNYTAVDLIAAHCGYGERDLRKVAEWAEEKLKFPSSFYGEKK